MVTIKKIKDLDFNTIQDYFEYIADSIVNGQRSQAKELIKDLSKQQRRAALNYFEFQIEEGELLDELREKLGAVKIHKGFLIK
jgi:hypothetical protein